MRFDYSNSTLLSTMTLNVLSILDNRDLTNARRQRQRKNRLNITLFHFLDNRDLTNARRQCQRKLHLNITLFHLCYFAIVLTSSTSTQTTNYPGTKLVRVSFTIRKRMKNSPPRPVWSFHVVFSKKTTEKCTTT